MTVHGRNSGATCCACVCARVGLGEGIMAFERLCLYVFVGKRRGRNKNSAECGVSPACA